MWKNEGGLSPLAFGGIMPKKSAPPPAEDMARARADLEKATEILFKAWGDWYRAPPPQSERAKTDVELAERQYREAQKKLDALAPEDDPSTR
jgi:hypothetical protein